MTNNVDLPFWLGLLKFKGFGPIRIKRLAAGFPSMREAFLASVGDLVGAGIEPAVAEKFIAMRSTVDPVAELARTEAAGLRALTVRDEDYPAALKTIHDPPAVLFVRGALPAADRPWISFVGSRHATRYGLESTKCLTEPLAAAGAVIVSGLAYGIDAAAHRAALTVGGTTVAVLGNGADSKSIYPPQHRALTDDIAAQGGAVISEFAPGYPSLPENFPRRNRVIAGLCRLTIVVEAAKDSGSLITTRYAMEHGRDVGAVPGPIDAPLSAGPHRLIRDGALCVTSAQDVLDALSLSHPPPFPLPTGGGPFKTQTYVPKNDTEKSLLDTLSLQDPRSADDLTERLGWPLQQVSSLLSILELAGAVKDAGSAHYVRSSA